MSSVHMLTYGLRRLRAMPSISHCTGTSPFGRVTEPSPHAGVALKSGVVGPLADQVPPGPSAEGPGPYVMAPMLIVPLPLVMTGAPVTGFLYANVAPVGTVREPRRLPRPFMVSKLNCSNMMSPLARSTVLPFP